METFTDTKKIASSEYVQSTQLMQKDLFNLIFLWPLVRVFIPSVCKSKGFSYWSMSCRSGVTNDHCWYPNMQVWTECNTLVADDTLIILMKTDASNANHLQGTFELYEECSGQVMNKEKPLIMFSKDTSGASKHACMNSLSFSTDSRREK